MSAKRLPTTNAPDAPGINAARQTRKIGEKLFTRVNGVWIDSGFKKEMPLAKITCLSDEYFALLADHPEIARFLALADRTIFHHRRQDRYQYRSVVKATNSRAALKATLNP
jgi:hypothetical protein